MPLEIPSRPAPRDELTARDFLDCPAREAMTAGVVTLVEDATLVQAYRAMRTHGVRGVLVTGRHGGRPIGWVTARGLLAWLGRDDEIVSVREAITEQPVTVSPSAPVREALALLSQPGTTHVLVAHTPDTQPEGVISELDVVELAIPSRS